MAIDHAKNTLFGGGKKRHSPLDRTKKEQQYTDKDRAAYEAYKKDFAADVATGKFGDKNRAPLTMSQAYRIGYKSPSQSKAALASSSREFGRTNIDENTGRSATRAMSAADKAAVGLGSDFKQRGVVVGTHETPIQRKKNPKRDSAKKAAKGKASAQYYSYGLTDKKSPAKRKKK